MSRKRKADNFEHVHILPYIEETSNEEDLRKAWEDWIYDLKKNIERERFPNDPLLRDLYCEGYRKGLEAMLQLDNELGIR